MAAQKEGGRGRSVSSFTSLASSPEIASRFVDADGVHTHYIEVGAGPPLLLVHGGGPGADAWGNWSACLPLYSRDFRVIAVDLAGFGRSEKPDPDAYEYAQHKRNRHLAAFITKLGLGRVNLVGNSMGGATALGVAMERPELVVKLVLMGSAGLDVARWLAACRSCSTRGVICAAMFGSALASNSS